MTNPPSESGERLLDDRYQLGERLGGGAVADVYRAVDERLLRPVAVKVFRGDAADQLQRHEAEMRTLAALDHPSLVTVFDAGTDDETGQPFLVMQLVEGSTLGDELRQSAPLPSRQVARYGAQLAAALAYVHERGLVHRDIKPANVLISEDGRLHLADFGIARIVDSAHETKTGDVLGTPAYFAPEQVAGEIVGPPADVYALGIVLFECLTGNRPFEGTAVEVAMARLARDPEIPANLPAGWRTLLERMTRRDPASRPTSAEVAEALRRLARGEDVGLAEDRTVAMTGPAATTVMPPVSVLHTQAMPPVGQRTVAPAARRRGPTPAVIALTVILVAAAVVAVVLVATRSDNGSSGQVKHGKPHLHAPLEHDVRQLEKLVTP